MNPKIIAFETQEKRFLRNVIEILQELNSSAIQECSKKLLIDKLISIIIDYQDFLPTEYYVLLHVLNDIITYKDDAIKTSNALSEAFTICEFLGEAPSFELFKKMSLCGIPLLYDHSGFSEELMLSIIETLKNTRINNYNPSENDILNSQTALNIMWISLAQMLTTEKVQLQAIRNVDLTGRYLITFCIELSQSCTNSDAVFLEIINRLESKKIFKNNKKDSEQKAQVYYTIMLCSVPSEIVVKKIIQVINPKKCDYFNTFYMIIKKYGKLKDVMETISSRLDIDEQSNNVEKSHILQLRLFTNNLIPTKII